MINFKKLKRIMNIKRQWHKQPRQEKIDLLNQTKKDNKMLHQVNLQFNKKRELMDFFLKLNNNQMKNLMM